MRCLLPLESIQLSAGDFPRLHGCLAVDFQVISGRDVMVDTEETFRRPGAEDAVGVEPVEEEVGDSAVGEVEAFWGCEAENCEEGTNIVLLVGYTVV